MEEIAKIAGDGALEWLETDFEHLQSKYNKKWL